MISTKKNDKCSVNEQDRPYPWDVAQELHEYNVGKRLDGSGGIGSPSRWWRIREQLYRPSLQFCECCSLVHSWTRETCVRCGKKLRPMTKKDAETIKQGRGT